LQRDKRNNDDQIIQPPLQNNYVNEEIEEVEENSKIHMIGEEFVVSHLTQVEYEDSLIA